MSEMKATSSGEIRARDALLGYWWYKKSEADKVIAELKADYKEACDRLQTANLIKDEQLAATRHSNYKRCLAMAEMCHILTNYGPEETSDFYDKWTYIWQELAEKFKEAK